MLKPPSSVNSRTDRLTRRASLKQEDKENSVKKEEPETSMQPDISVSAETETICHEASDDAQRFQMTKTRQKLHKKICEVVWVRLILATILQVSEMQCMQ